MGAIIAVGSTAYVVQTVATSLGYVAPAARLSNQWDTKVGGALADAISCNAVVKSFGAEEKRALHKGNPAGWLLAIDSDKSSQRNRHARII